MAMEQSLTFLVNGCSGVKVLFEKPNVPLPFACPEHYCGCHSNVYVQTCPLILLVGRCCGNSSISSFLLLLPLAVWCHQLLSPLCLRNRHAIVGIRMCKLVNCACLIYIHSLFTLLMWQCVLAVGHVCGYMIVLFQRWEKSNSRNGKLTILSHAGSQWYKSSWAASLQSVPEEPCS